MSPSQKMARVRKLTHAVQHLALARIEQQYGKISESEQRLRLAALLLDRNTMRRFFQWYPAEKGFGKFAIPRLRLLPLGQSV